MVADNVCMLYYQVNEQGVIICYALVNYGDLAVCCIIL